MIGAFGRLVGLTPSALRFYDDSGLLRPARADPVTGYRLYTVQQERRAVLLRDLREIGLPLSAVRVVLGDRAPLVIIPLRTFRVDGAPRRLQSTAPHVSR